MRQPAPHLQGPQLAGGLAAATGIGVVNQAALQRARCQPAQEPTRRSGQHPTATLTPCHSLLCQHSRQADQQPALELLLGVKEVQQLAVAAVAGPGARVAAA